MIRSRARRILPLAMLTQILASCANEVSAATIEWRPEDNPHVLTSDFVVGPGNLLRILAGVEVRLAYRVALRLSGGRLEALGTETSPILFTRRNPDPYWKSVVLQNSTNNVIRHAIFEYSSTDSTLSPWYGGALYMEQATAEVAYSEFRNTRFAGVYGEGYSEVEIHDCYFHDTGAEGIHIKWGASARITRCGFQHVGFTPPYRMGSRDFLRDAVEFTGDSPDARFHEIDGCWMNDIADNGVDVDREIDAKISNTTISHCGDKGISVSMGSRSTITNCIMVDNGWGLAAQSGGVLDAANCTIYGGIFGLRARVKDAGWPGGTATVKNVIIWNTSQPSVVKDAESTITATNCDLEDPYAGAGNLSADPLFADAPAGNFRLLASSPCIDSGSSFYPATDHDMQGKAASTIRARRTPAADPSRTTTWESTSTGRASSASGRPQARAACCVFSRTPRPRDRWRTSTSPRPAS